MHLRCFNVSKNSCVKLLVRKFGRVNCLTNLMSGDILADTAILSNVSKKEPLCSCYEHTSRACLQLNGMAAEKRGLCLSGKSVNMQLFLKDSHGP